MAVDFTSRATFADLTSPEGKAAFDAFIAGARARRARDVKALHVFQRDDGQLFNLDFGIAASDLETLMASCSQTLLSYKPEAVMPLQPEIEWWNFWTSPLLRRYMRMHCPTHRASNVFLTLRGGAWPA